LCALALSALFFLNLATAQSAPDKLTPAQLQTIRALIDKTMEAHKVPGATFAIGLNGQIAWSEGFGFADVENQVKASPDTAYRTASIGKAMTATAALQLAEQHKLDLDVPMQKYCPRYPEKKYPVTARDLISHTSVIRHYEGPNVDAELFNTRHYDHVSDSIDLIKDDPLKQQPAKTCYIPLGDMSFSAVFWKARRSRNIAHLCAKPSSIPRECPALATTTLAPSFRIAPAATSSKMVS
jgi:CubicO group peptidase (beta-lactamase class C family)